MTRKQRIEASKIANYILNNMTMAEILDILAKKSADIANEIVLKKLPVQEYKKLLILKKAKKAKKVKSFKKEIKVNTEAEKGALTKVKDFFVKLFKDDPPPPEPEKNSKRSGWSTKAKKRKLAKTLRNKKNN